MIRNRGARRAVAVALMVLGATADAARTARVDWHDPAGARHRRRVGRDRDRAQGRKVAAGAPASHLPAEEVTVTLVLVSVRIPRQRRDSRGDYTCEGDDVSPPLAWSGIPPGTRSLALIVDDPDAPDPKHPKVVWVHWVLYNMPAERGRSSARRSSRRAAAGHARRPQRAGIAPATADRARRSAGTAISTSSTRSTPNCPTSREPDQPTLWRARWKATCSRRRNWSARTGSPAAHEAERRRHRCVGPRSESRAERSGARRMSWEHFAHDADIGVRGSGATLAGAFEQAAVALTAVVTDPRRVAPTRSRGRALRGAGCGDAARRLAERADLRDGDPPACCSGASRWRSTANALEAQAWGEPLDRIRPPAGRRGQGRDLHGAGRREGRRTARGRRSASSTCDRDATGACAWIRAG